MSLIDATVARVSAVDSAAAAAAVEQLDRMTKPRGSLGRIEDVAVTLAAIAGACPPPLPSPVAVAVFAADHGVHARGVTSWPQEVTAQMVANFLAGGAVVNAFARTVDAEVVVVDVGVVNPLEPTPGLLSRRVGNGTGDITRGPAMTREQAEAAVVAGITVAAELVETGHRCLVPADMGIANTTVAAALICAFTGAEPAAVTGRGTGIDDDVLAHKIAVVEQALALHHPDPADPIGVLAAVGGFEHAAIAGLVLGAAAHRLPVVLDGVSVGAGALAAVAMAPAVLGYCIAGHRSVEPGHRFTLEALGLDPLLDLDMRLGEGTGALLALPVVRAAAQALHDVATFDAAGVAEKQH